MGTARGDTYSAPSGGGIYAGRPAPASAAPLWMQNAVVGQWTALPNSAGAGGATVNAYSGFVVDDSLTIWIAAAGGHTDSSDNRVVKYNASVDTPTGWEVVRAATTPVQTETPYYNDGRPSSRHTYHYSYFDVPTRRIMLLGLSGTWSSGGAFNTIDGFNTATGDWDPAGTYPYTYGTTLVNLPYAYGATQDKSSGYFFWKAGNNWQKWKPGQATVTDISSTPFDQVRFPSCWDSTRQALFGLMWGDGQGYNSGVVAKQSITPSTALTNRNISFNASAAYTQFQADIPAYAGMDYDRFNDQFLFINGTTIGIGGTLRIYQVKPNSGTTWDMSIYTPGGSVNPGSITPNGVQGRWKWMESGGIGGFMFMPQASAGLFFLRTH